MAIIYTDAIKHDRMEVVRAAIDAGTGPGKIQLFDFAGTTLLVDIPFIDPCGSVSGGVLTFTMPIIEPIALETGTAVNAKIVTSADVLVVSGLTVGTVGTDVLLNSTQITAGQPCKVLTASITHG